MFFGNVKFKIYGVNFVVFVVVGINILVSVDIDFKMSVDFIDEIFIC